LLALPNPSRAPLVIGKDAFAAEPWLGLDSERSRLVRLLSCRRPAFHLETAARFPEASGPVRASQAFPKPAMPPLEPTRRAPGPVASATR